ncbi:hypothetical protein [Novosphingobium ginsenosidimutans]|uniref:hypothetical protein n=1 Tax=Novosphingobium ginsenosidimutans TaxID=1176536 RepID=UPI001EE381E1|nr:hypothetical protein [Novosphingobium ginsenosidimutans]
MQTSLALAHRRHLFAQALEPLRMQLRYATLAQSKQQGNLLKGQIITTQRTMVQLAVISVDEIPTRMSLSSFDVVRLEPASA